MDRPILYRFDGHRPWLEAWVRWKRVDEPKFSCRRFIEQTGDRNPSVLHHVIWGVTPSGRPRAVLTESWARRWVGPLGIGAGELELFLAFVNRERWFWEAEKWRRRGPVLAGSHVRWPHAGHHLRFAEAQLVHWEGEAAAARGRARGEELSQSPVIASAAELLSWGLPGSAPNQLGLLREWAERAPAAILRCLPTAQAAPIPLFGLTEAMDDDGWPRVILEAGQFAAAVLARFSGEEGARWHLRLTAFPTTVRWAPLEEPLLAVDADPSLDLTVEPEVFDYEAAGEWLRAWVTWLQHGRRRRSLAELSRLVARAGTGVDAHGRGAGNRLTRLLRGEVRLTPAVAELLGRAAGLHEDERRYLVALATGEGARGDGKKRAFERARALRVEWQTLGVHPTRIGGLTHGIAFTIAELARCPGFVVEPRAVANAMRPPIAEAQAAQVLASLAPQGNPLEWRPDQAANVLMAVGPREYHLDMKALEIEVLRRAEWAPEESEGVAVAVTLPVAGGRASVFEFVEEMARHMSQITGTHGEVPTRVYQVNLHGFEV